MSDLHPADLPLSPEFIESVCARIADDKRVRRTLSAGGLLHLDRRLPFLCVYRKPAGRPDLGTHQLITGEAVFLVAGDEIATDPQLATMVVRIAETAAAAFGAFLVLEVWAGDVAPTPPRDPLTGEPLFPPPEFHLRTRGPGLPEPVLERLAGTLRNVKLYRQKATVDVDRAADPFPPHAGPLIDAADARRINCHFVGLEVAPIYRDAETGNVFPRALRTLRRSVHRAFIHTFFAYSHAATNARPAHFHVYGRRTISRDIFEADRQLAAISNTFDFLLQCTPANVAAAWRAFKQNGYETSPRFQYRPLAVEPSLLKRKLYEVPLERIEDPTINHILHQKLDELDRKITMLGDVGTPRFLPGSLQVYGGVEPLLLELAHEILRIVPARAKDDQEGTPLDAHAFADRALVEVARYRDRFPDFNAQVIVRDDLYAGLLVSQGDLLIGRKFVIPHPRVEALLQHEIGTHSLTSYNGRSQPLQLLHAGLAGYEGFQEGLAVLAEYLVGGLSRPRLRLLAARVVAAYHVSRGTTFVETFDALHRDHGYGRRTAFTIAMRVHRGGGLTKDAVYLRGLVEILHYLRGGGALDPLFIGKMAADHVPVVEELLHRNVLHPPPLRPLYLDKPEVHARLDRLHGGLSVLQLIEEPADEDRIRRQRRADRTGRVHHDPAGHGRPEPGT